MSALETPRLPLSAYKKSNAFKLYLNDVGLLGRKFDLDVQTVLAGDNLFTEFKGVMAENYVLQSLVRQFGNSQYYWTSGNMAKVEFVLQADGKIIPIEVKADKNVTAKVWRIIVSNIPLNCLCDFPRSICVRMTICSICRCILLTK